MKSLQSDILRTLLYYDIWHYPLTATELFTFLPVNSMTFEEFDKYLREQATGDDILFDQGYYFVRGKGPGIVPQRREKEHHAQLMWRMAAISMHIIKRFPFVRGVCVSGDLSKNATNRKSDVDFFVITEPGRLWITRTLLILFKKVFLLNSKKYFCLNYFVTTDHLTLDDHNVFLATEIAHLKPLYNSGLFRKYFASNQWIRDYFPNYDLRHLQFPVANERQSLLQRLLEIPFSFIAADTLNTYLMNKMAAIWARRYPEFDDTTRRKIFRCTKSESRAYVGNFEEKILAIYEQKLREFGVSA